MEVARTTAQAIYASARKKLAQCIVQGRRMKIAGGDVQVCEHRKCACNRCCGRFIGMENSKKEDERNERNL